MVKASASAVVASSGHEVEAAVQCCMVGVSTLSDATSNAAGALTELGVTGGSPNETIGLHRLVVSSPLFESDCLPGFSSRVGGCE